MQEFNNQESPIPNQQLKNQVEAVLFTLGRFASPEEIAEFCKISSIESIKQAIGELIQEYQNKDSALEMTEQGNKYKLNIRKQYLHLTTKLLKDTELDRPTQETLALIAYKNPVFQSKIVHMRGNKAYDHIAKLKELEFVSSEKAGRTRLLKTTSRFYDYFDVVDSSLKEKFDMVFSEKIVEENIPDEKET
ncbi:MAG: SMC-Scp complex subunit ScpB [Nanoarchaeota archaeon]|nr:SMC-Scp complex subunit ScpB [Nanoarchaeota archaeon]